MTGDTAKNDLKFGEFIEFTVRPFLEAVSGRRLKPNKHNNYIGDFIDERGLRWEVKFDKLLGKSKNVLIELFENRGKDGWICRNDYDVLVMLSTEIALFMMYKDLYNYFWNNFGKKKWRIVNGVENNKKGIVVLVPLTEILSELKDRAKIYEVPIDVGGKINEYFR